MVNAGLRCAWKLVVVKLEFVAVGVDGAVFVNPKPPTAPLFKLGAKGWVVLVDGCKERSKGSAAAVELNCLLGLPHRRRLTVGFKLKWVAHLAHVGGDRNQRPL